MFESPSNANHYDVQMGKDIFKCFEKHKNNYTDFTVNVCDTKFNCHRFVLSSCSSFFEALMRTDMREKSESCCTIKGITPEIFGHILDVIYEGRNVLDEENMLEMWHASNQLQIYFLILACEKFVNENLTLQNYWTIYEAAKILDSFVVLTKVKQFMVNQFPMVVRSDAFIQITFEEFKDILKHFQMANDFVVNSVLKWACSDESYLTTEPDNFIRTLRVDESETGLQNVLCKKVIVGTDEIENIKLRRSYLGQLLAVISIKDISTACLSKLMSNKFVIDNKEAITLIIKQAASRLESTKPALFKNYRTGSAIKTTPTPPRKYIEKNKNLVTLDWPYFDIPHKF